MKHIHTTIFLVISILSQTGAGLCWQSTVNGPDNNSKGTWKRKIIRAGQRRLERSLYRKFNPDLFGKSLAYCSVELLNRNNIKVSAEGLPDQTLAIDVQ